MSTVEKGFFHPSRGYWQSVSVPSADMFAKYPPSTVEVPLKPNGDCEWDGSKWVDVPLPTPTQAEQEAQRQAAFQSEADPLFFKWQAGEGTEAEWLMKREEIRNRFPYPTDAPN
jgi:hypothetical protein